METHKPGEFLNYVGKLIINTYMIVNFRFKLLQLSLQYPFPQTTVCNKDAFRPWIFNCRHQNKHSILNPICGSVTRLNTP